MPWLFLQEGGKRSNPARAWAVAGRNIGTNGQGFDRNGHSVAAPIRRTIAPERTAASRSSRPAILRRGHTDDPTDPRLRRPVRQRPAGRPSLRTPRAARRRPGDRHPLLRRLPLGPPSGAQRMAQQPVPAGAGPRDHRPGRQRRRGGERFRGRRTGRRRLHGRLLPALRRLLRGPGAVLRGIPDPDLQRPRPPRRPADLRRLLGAHRGLLQVRPAHSPGARPEGGGAAAVRRDHVLLATASLEDRPR